MVPLTVRPPVALRWTRQRSHRLVAWTPAPAKAAVASSAVGSRVTFRSPSGNLAATFRFLSTTASVPRTRRPSFDLPRPVDTSKYQLATNPARKDGGLDEPELAQAVRIDAVTSSDVKTVWPLPGMVEAPPVHHEVKRPNLWLRDEATVGVDDVGRFVTLPRDDLISLLPEGACGELARDLMLIPSRTRKVGIMLRKVCIELIMQLSLLRDAKNSKGEYRIPKAGFLLDGHSGVGKSQCLNFLVMWARRNGWLVIMEPHPSRYSREIADIKRSNNGVYIQSEFSQQFLEALSLSNRQQLSEIPVDYSRYGTRALDGEPTSWSRLAYDPLITKTVDRQAEDEGLTGADRLKRIDQYRRKVKLPSMLDQLPRPENVWEIVEFGLENESYAAQAVAEMFLQLQWQTTHPVLVVVDEWNACFPTSQYVSIRYDNTRFNGYIPAYHLTMPRTLHRWDGGKYRRGLKICATTWRWNNRRDYKPELLGVKDHEIRTVRSFTQHEFANYVTYLRLMNVLHNFPREDLEYFYMMSQGNGHQARKLLSTLY